MKSVFNYVKDSILLIIDYTGTNVLILFACPLDSFVDGKLVSQ